MAAVLDRIIDESGPALDGFGREVVEDPGRISAWVAMAAVPALIAGVHGMNFDHMPELHSRYGYPVVLVGMALVALAMFRAFRRSD